MFCICLPWDYTITALGWIRFIYWFTGFTTRIRDFFPLNSGTCSRIPGNAQQEFSFSQYPDIFYIKAKLFFWKRRYYNNVCCVIFRCLSCREGSFPFILAQNKYNFLDYSRYLVFIPPFSFYSWRAGGESARICPRVEHSFFKGSVDSI